MTVYSFYAYAGNNPLGRIDPTGMGAITSNGDVNLQDLGEVDVWGVSKFFWSLPLPGVGYNVNLSFAEVGGEVE